MNVACFFSGMQHSNSMSGGDRHGLEIWQAWQRQKVATVTVLCPIQGREICDYFGYHFQFVVTERTRSIVGSNRLGYVARFLNALTHLRRVGQAQLIYASSPYFYDVIPAIFLKCSRRGAKLVSPLFHLIPRPRERQGSFLVNALAWLEQRLMIRILGVFADLVITDNVDVADALRRRGVPPKKVFVSKMGIAPARQIPVTDLCRSRVAVCVGRLSEAKGVNVLLAAWQLVAQREPDARLVLIGNPSPDYDAHREIQCLGVEKSVLVYSGLSDEQVQAVLDTARFFVTASREEGYGLAVQEALSRGLPCVTFDLPAFASAFPYGRKIVPIDDIRGFADAMVAMFGDPELTALARMNQLNTFYTWDQVAAEVWKACEEA